MWTLLEWLRSVCVCMRARAFYAWVCVCIIITIFRTRNSSGDEIANVNFLWRGLGEMWDVYLGLIRKRVIDFMLVLIKLFLAGCYHWGATSDNRSKIGYFAPTRSLWSKISARRDRSPLTMFARIVRPMNALQLCCWQFSHSCYGWGATSESRSKIGDFAATRLLWSKISVTGGRRPPIIFGRLVRPMNALQFCRWQFSHK